MASIGIVGLGNMGTAVGHILTIAGNSVLGWDVDPDVVRLVNEEHSNKKYFPSVTLAETMHATEALDNVLACDVVMICIPVRFIREVLKGKDISRAICVSLAKGIEPESGYRASQVLSELGCKDVVVLSGPSVANVFGSGMDSFVNVAGPKAGFVRDLFSQTTLHCNVTSDLNSIELCGVLKNIYSLGMGILEGQGHRSMRSVYVMLALSEIRKTFESWGMDVEVVYGLSGLADLLETSLSEMSHNRNFGKNLAIGKTSGMQPEGFYSISWLAAHLGGDFEALPLTQCIYDNVQGKKRDFAKVINDILA